MVPLWDETGEVTAAGGGNRKAKVREACFLSRATILVGLQYGFTPKQQGRI